MSHFIFPQAWIGPAITAAALAFGSLDDTTRVIYRDLPGQSIGGAVAPNKILIDKKPAREWPREKAQCVLAHEYGHLRGREHSANPRSIMYFKLLPGTCHRWLVRHGLSSR